MKMKRHESLEGVHTHTHTHGNLKKEKGITLIALVITIIILLILAGITIVQLTGSGLFGKTELANKKTRYSTAKETVNLKLMEIQVDSIENNEEYNIRKIAKGMEEAEDITIEKYYNKETDTQITELEGIVVSVDKYSEYKFLIGEKCEITGVLEGKVTNTTSKEDFIEVSKFENNPGTVISKSEPIFKANETDITNWKATGVASNYVIKEEYILLATQNVGGASVYCEKPINIGNHKKIKVKRTFGSTGSCASADIFFGSSPNISDLGAYSINTLDEEVVISVENLANQEVYIGFNIIANAGDSRGYFINEVQFID